MLIIFLQLFSLPLLGLALLAAVDSGELGRRPLEQLQLDAVSLSLCHHDQDTLHQVGKLNGLILQTQRALDSAFTACETQALSSSIAYLVSFEACARAFLLPLVRWGQSLEKKQEAWAHHRRTLAKEAFFLSLLSKNEIPFHEIQLNSQAFESLDSAMIRSPLKSFSRLAEAAAQAHAGSSYIWPRLWVARHSTFKQLMKLNMQRFPHRELPEIHKNSPLRWRSLRASASAKSQSECRTQEQRAGFNYEVLWTR
jgi:hypothetical protein